MENRNRIPAKLREAQQLRREIELDSLTGVYNKTAFYRKTRQLLGHGTEQKYDLLYVDIDSFKMVNTCAGEKEGDKLLAYIAAWLSGRVDQRMGLCGRLCADRFVVCVPRNREFEEKLMYQINEDLEDYPLPQRIVLRFGIYQIEDLQLPVHVMCDWAAIAAGAVRGNYEVHTTEFAYSYRDALFNEQQILDDVSDAFENERFRINLQPWCSLKTGGILGCEVLARWVHPKKGIIMPMDFIPVFEKRGMIHKLDLYIWERTCCWMRGWYDQGGKKLPVSVNASRISLAHPEIDEELISLVKRYDIEPGQLELEITESAYREDPQELIRTVQKLRQKGFKILLDDFGSGYSSLNMLKDIPADMLKVDLHFLSGDDQYGRGEIILTAVARMAQELKLPTIIEGVESEQQVELLKKIGCVQAQGCYFHRPMEPGELEALLRRDGQEACG